jgi:protein-disulfide isomerase
VVEPQVLRQYIETGKAKLIWHDFPWIGQESTRAAQAARCAGRQGQFWEYHDYLYAHQRGENQGQFSAANLKAFAAALNLDVGTFGACLDKGEDQTAIRQDFNAGRTRGVNATPYFHVNGRPSVGAGPFAQFAEALDAELRRMGG